MKSGRGESPWKRDIKIRETRRNKITGVSRIMKSRCDRKFEALIKHRPLFVDVYPLQKTRYRILLYRYLYIYIYIGRNRICDSSWKVLFNSDTRVLISFIPFDFYFIYIYIFSTFYSMVKLIFDTFEWRIKVWMVYRKSIVYRTRIFEIMQITG